MPLPQPVFNAIEYGQGGAQRSNIDLDSPRNYPSPSSDHQLWAPPAPRRIPAHRGNWRLQTDIKIKFTSAGTRITTKAIWDAFRTKGHIIYIELYHDTKGQPDGSGIVRFCPPPREEFWRNERFSALFPPDSQPRTLRVKLLQSDPREYRAPLNGRFYPERLVVLAATLTFGYLHGPTTMQTMYTVRPTQHAQIKVVQDLNYRNIDIYFPIEGIHKQIRTYRIRLSHASKLQIFQPDPSDKESYYKRLVLSVDTPPNFSIKSSAGETHRSDARAWSENDQWYRYGNITESTKGAQNSSRPSTSLNVVNAVVNIGRWTSYSLEFHEGSSGELNMFCDALRDFNIAIKQDLNFKYHADPVQPVWTMIDRPVSTEQAHSDSLAELMDQTVTPLPFEVRYQLEVCLSEGRLNEYTIPRQFIDHLRELEEGKAIELLEEVAAYEGRFYDPMEIFNSKELRKKKARKNKLPTFCTVIRSALVTPTTIHFSSPTVEISNRVIRQYKKYSNHFLRVRFSDEKPQGKIYAKNDTMMHVLQRIKNTLTNGIDIGDRHYEFLAFGNSQLREHGAYFWSPVPHVTTERIRAWMGDFEDIPQVAKYAARLGQCFSTTRAIHTARAQLEEFPDVMSADRRYNFTDGVGQISKGLATLAATEMGIPMIDNDPPSVLQFRLGGCKGVLAVWPQPNNYLRIHVRPSQYKFHAQYEGLEVIRWSQFSSAHLNQQIIAVLSALGVEDHVFMEKMRCQLSKLSDAISNEKVALKMLQKEVDHNQQSLVLATMVSDGFQRARDPFMISVLNLWRAWNIKYLKEKAKIVIPNGAVLLGCTDEAQILKGHFDHFQPRSDFPTQRELFDSTPEVFVQLSKGANDKPEVIEGFMLLARNPSLHPGDIRVVRGVNKLELRHLKDVVVLPQTGDRDIASMCSGGDLDGDDYVVMWDPDLVPRTWNYPPMDYTPPSPVYKSSAVTIDDITSFFVEYMRNDSLPDIACAHRAQADYNEDGVMNSKCIELAKLHSQAVDFPKSGQTAKMNQALRPRKYPHWMGRRPGNSYKSSKVLGKLYDEVELIDFEPEYSLSFDSRIVQQCLDVDQEMLSAARVLKQRYDDAVRRIMSQYAIKTEFEVWSTFVMDHIKQGSDYKFHETIGQLSTALKETYRDECIEKAGGRDMSKLGPFVKAMYYITHEQYALANQRWERLHCSARDARARGEELPMFSFPWLFPTILGEIAIGERHTSMLNMEIQDKEFGKRTGKHAKATKLSMTLDDTVQTAGGVTHRGDLLEMFTGNNPQQVSNTDRLVGSINQATPTQVQVATNNSIRSNTKRPHPALPAGQAIHGKKIERHIPLTESNNESQETVVRRDLPQRRNARLLHNLDKMQQ